MGLRPESRIICSARSRIFTAAGHVEHVDRASPFLPGNGVAVTCSTRSTASRTVLDSPNHVLVPHRQQRPAALKLRLKERHDRAGRAQHVAEAHRNEARALA